MNIYQITYSDLKTNKSGYDIGLHSIRLAAISGQWLALLVDSS